MMKRRKAEKKADRKADRQADRKTKKKADHTAESARPPGNARAPGEKRYWLVKSEPETFSFDDLLRIHNKTTNWNGIRNFVARGYLRDGLKLGDRVFFYHSGAAPAIVGICEVVREGYPDHTAFDPADSGYDPASEKERPRWFQVDLRAVAQFTRPVTLAQIKARKELKDMTILRIGRLSVTPVAETEWRVITEMAQSQ
jgi:predicted RNA-binding protein with PUA-like domain